MNGMQIGGDTIEVIVRDSQHHKIFQGFACLSNPKSIDALFDVLKKKGFDQKSEGMNDFSFDDFY